MPAPKCGGLAISQGEGVIRYAIALLVVLFLAVPSSGAAAGNRAEETRAPQDLRPAIERTEAKGCPYAHLGLAFYRGRYAGWQLKRGATVLFTGRQPRSCADARYLAHVWSKRAHDVRMKYVREAKEKLEAMTLDDFDDFNGSHPWLKAVDEVQVAYPGTKAWLLSCSDSEGGWGRWVPNSQGSGVGGWLQFMPGTWAGFYRHAVDDVRSRGFRVPASSASWYSALGQALAGAWGITHGMRHHWAGRGCW